MTAYFEGNLSFEKKKNIFFSNRKLILSETLFNKYEKKKKYSEQ